MSGVIPVSEPVTGDAAFALLLPFARIDGREVLSTADDGDVVRDLLRDAVMISLFSDRRAEDDQAPARERRGWWGDPLMGSRLWLLWRRGRLDTQTQSDARAYCEEALSWLVEDGIAARVEVAVTLLPRSLSVAIRVVRPDGRSLDYRFGPLWR